MASPQTGDGFTKIANEILDAICQYAFNGSQLRIIMKVWRLTYGYGRKDHDFSQSFIRDTTGLSESTVKREINSLIKKKVLLVTKNPTKTEARRLAFNKDYEQWDFEKEGVVVKGEYDLFSDAEGSDLTPHETNGGGFRLDPCEGSDTTPLNDDMRGQIRPLYKESNSLKKSIKEKEAYFEKWYEIYPRRLSKKKAESSWKTLCKESNFDPDKAILQTMNFADTCTKLKTETKFIPYPATFLNQKRYEDYVSVDPEGLANEKQSKLGSNLDFLAEQLRGGENESEGSHIDSSKSFSSLPESST